MITNIKSINVFPSWGCCSLCGSGRAELSCCCFGHYFLCSTQEYTLMIQDAHAFSNLKVSCKAKLEIELSWEVNVEQTS